MNRGGQTSINSVSVAGIPVNCASQNSHLPLAHTQCLAMTRKPPMTSPQDPQEPDLPLGTIVTFTGDFESLFKDIPERTYLEPAITAHNAFKITDMTREHGPMRYEIEPLAELPTKTYHWFYVWRKEIEVVE
jgi:hypothetical protein